MASLPSSDQLPSERDISSSAQSFHDDTMHSLPTTPEHAQLRDDQPPPSPLRQNIFMVFITLTQLVQMIPLGAGINSSLSIGEALGATNVESVWIVASYPLTQGSFVLIGKCFLVT